MLQHIKEHAIVCIGKIEDGNNKMVEVIPQNPKNFLEEVIRTGCYISEIRWWDRTLISTGSKIGYGGPRDPRDPQNYYFAETDICASFVSTTTFSEYAEYLDRIKEQYSAFDIYPAFDVYYKTK